MLQLPGIAATVFKYLPGMSAQDRTAVRIKSQTVNFCRKSEIRIHKTPAAYPRHQKPFFRQHLKSGKNDLPPYPETLRQNPDRVQPVTGGESAADNRLPQFPRHLL